MSYINWFPLDQRSQDGLTIIVDKTWEDMDPADCFDTSIDPSTNKPYFDVEQMRKDIDAGDLDWFILRARVLLDDLELGRSIVGGFLYKDAEEVLTDGTADDLIAEALHEARNRAVKLKLQLEELGI